MPQPQIRTQDLKTEFSGRLQQSNKGVITTVDISVAANIIDVGAGNLKLYLEPPEGGTPLGPFDVVLESDGTDGRWKFETTTKIFDGQPTGRWGAMLHATFVDTSELWTDYEYFRVGPAAIKT